MRIYALQYSDEDVLKPSLIRTIKPHTSPVVISIVDSTGTLLATGASDGVVKVWDIRGGFVTHTLHGHGGVVSALHFFTLSEQSTSLRLASGNEDGKVRIWNLNNRKVVANLDAHVSVVRSLDYHNGIFLSASRDRTIMLWDTNTWKSRIIIPTSESLEDAKMFNDSVIVTGGESGQIKLWSLASGEDLTAESKEETPGILQIIRNDILGLLIAVHTDQTLILSSTTPLTTSQTQKIFPELPILRRISGTHDEVIDLAYVGSNQQYLAVATNVEELRILSLTTSAEAGEYFGSDVGLLSGHEDIIICLDVDWSGHWIATGAKDNTARLWKIDPKNKSFSCYATYTGHAESLGAVALPKTIPTSGTTEYINPLNHPPPFLMTGSQDKTIKRWDTTNIQKDSGKAMRATYTRKAHDKDINAIDIDHKSSRFASASQDRTVRIWSCETGEAVGVLRGHKRGVWSVKFAPSGTPNITTEDGGQASIGNGLVITGSGDKTVKLWSLNDYSCLRTFEGHTNSALKVVWMSPPRNDTEKTESARAIDSAKHRTQIASAGGDGLVKVWDADTGELACNLDNHTDRVWALALNTATNGLISGGGDSVITFWKDTSTTTATAIAAASTARVEQDQALQNHIRAGSYREAITLALALNHPARLLGLFTKVTGTYPPEDNSLCGVKAVDEVLAHLADDQLLTLLGRLRDWNTNARTSLVAQRVLWTLLKSYPPSKFIQLSQRRGGAGVKELMDAVRAYTERHLRRMEDLIDESYVVEYTIREMATLGIEAPQTNGVKATH